MPHDTIKPHHTSLLQVALRIVHWQHSNWLLSNQTLFPYKIDRKPFDGLYKTKHLMADLVEGLTRTQTHVIVSGAAHRCM
jgi:hypothetical protein